MSIYVADLSSTSGWTERFQTGLGAFTTITDGFEITKSGETTIYGISLDAIDSDADRDDVEILAKVRFTTSADATATVGVFARGTTGDNCVAAVLWDGDNNATTNLRPQVIDYASGSGSYGSSVARANVANTWYWFRFRVNGTNAKCRVWADGETEPSAWDTDDTISTAGVGWAGVFADDTATDPYELGYFAIATNGDSIGGGSRVQFIGV